jgi:hypothetical protein
MLISRSVSSAIFCTWLRILGPVDGQAEVENGGFSNRQNFDS